MRLFISLLVLILMSVSVMAQVKVDRAWLESIYKSGTLSAEDNKTMWQMFRQHDKDMAKQDPKYVSNSNTIDVMAMLPETLGSIKSPGGVYSYEFDQSGLGYGKAYISREPLKNVTVYSYHSNFKKIPDGVESDILKGAFAQSDNDIYASKLYGKIEAGGNGTMEFKGKKFLWANYFLPDTQRGIVMFLFMTAHNNSLIKVRYDVAIADTPSEEDKRLAKCKEGSDYNLCVASFAISAFMEDLAGSLK